VSIPRPFLLSKNKNLKIARTKGMGNRFAFVAHTDGSVQEQGRDAGLKYGIDRKKIVQERVLGLCHRWQRPHHRPAEQVLRQKQKQSPTTRTRPSSTSRRPTSAVPIELQVSEGAFSGATDSAVVFQESAARRPRDNLDVKRVSGDGYWDNVWLKVPFCAVYWGNRPTIDLQLSQTFVPAARPLERHPLQQPEIRQAGG
jgi:peptide/nickel transport system substrate-binding protein